MVNKKYLLLANSSDAIEVSIQDAAPIVAANFPEDILVKYLVNEGNKPEDVQLILKLKDVNPYFISRIESVREFLKKNRIVSYKDYERFCLLSKATFMSAFRKVIRTQRSKSPVNSISLRATIKTWKLRSNSRGRGLVESKRKRKLRNARVKKVKSNRFKKSKIRSF